MRRAAVVVGVVLLVAGCGQATQDRPLLPPRGFVADAARGEALYGRYCVGCHGPGGSGTEKGPPFLSDVYRPAHHSDIAFYKAARDGVRAHHWTFGDMPPVAGISPEEVGHIIAYVRERQRAAGIR